MLFELTLRTVRMEKEKEMEREKEKSTRTMIKENGFQVGMMMRRSYPSKKLRLQ